MSTVKVNSVCATSDVLGVSSNSGEVPDPPPTLEHEAVSSSEELTVIL